MLQVQVAWRSECARKVRKSPNPPGLQEMLKEFYLGVQKNAENYI